MKHLQYKKRAKEQGVALIFALGILSLLLITALAFAMSSLMSQKEAKNNLNRNNALNLANLASERIMATLKYMNANGRLDQSKYLVSRNNSNIHAASHDDRIGADYTDTNLLNVYYNRQDYSPNDYLPEKILPQWEYILDSYNTTGGSYNTSGSTTETDTTSKIIGRIAYWALPEYGTVNLSEVILGNAPTLADSYEDSTDKYDTNNRFGRSIREIDITGVSSDLPYTNNTNSTDLLNQIYLATYQDDGDDSDDQITNLLDILNAVPLINDEQRDWISETFSPAGQNEPEIYYYASDGDGSFTNRKNFTQYHRFNLCNERWDYGLSVGDSKANSEEALELLFSDDVEFDINGATESYDDYGLTIQGYENGNTTTTTKQIGLPFLRMIGVEAGPYGDIQTRRKQIGANLLDYCDSDDTPTSDVDASSWSSDPDSDAPTYTGNEKTPYINEIAFDIAVTATREDIVNTETTLVTDSKLTFSAYITNLDLELFDIYKYGPDDTPLSGTFSLSFSGTVTVELSSSDFEETEILELTFDHMRSHTIPNSSSSRYTTSVGISDDDLPKVATDIEVTISNPEAANDPEATMTLTGVKLTHVLLKYSGSGIDFVHDLSSNIESSSAETITLKPDTTNTTSSPLIKRFDVAFSVDDPRENLYQSFEEDGNKIYNWEYYSETHEDTTSTSSIRTIGAKNTNCIPNTIEADGDTDTLTDTASTTEYAISTGYIRNGDMLSPMELGAIHRARKWQTINLKKAAKSTPDEYKKYDSSTYGEESEADSLSYSEGDGAILNHIKMSKDIYSPGKVNLNSKSTITAGDWAKYIHAFLLKGVIAEGATYDVENSTASGITISDAKTFATKLDELTETSDDYIASRAELISSKSSYDLSTLGGQLSFSTDAEKEAIAGKIMHLLSTEEIVSTQYKFVIVAQTIKDVGGVDIDKNYFQQNGTIASSSATIRDTRFGVFDMDSTDLDYSIDNTAGTPVYGDEITGEVKVLVIIDFDTSVTPAKASRISFELID